MPVKLHFTLASASQNCEKEAEPHLYLMHHLGGLNSGSSSFNHPTSRQLWRRHKKIDFTLGFPACLCNNMLCSGPPEAPTSSAPCACVSPMSRHHSPGPTARTGRSSLCRYFGQIMGYMVLHRYMWLMLADQKDADRKALLNTPLSASGLFGDAVEAIMKCFSEAQKRSKAMTHFQPRCARAAQSSAHSRSTSASHCLAKQAPSAPTSSVPYQEPSVHAKTASQRAPKMPHGLKNKDLCPGSPPPLDQRSLS